MTHFLLALSWNWLLVPVAVWFLRSLYVVMQRPRIRYLAHTKAQRGRYFLTVERQQRLPPWLAVKETWLVDPSGKAICTREVDGKCEGGFDARHSFLGDRLISCLNIALARDAETEELLK